MTASQQGAGPDVTVGAHDWIGNLVQSGAIDPVQLTDQQLAGFPELQADGEASEIMCLQVGEQGDAYHIYPLYTSGGGYLFGTTEDGTWDPADLGVGSDESKAAFERIRELGEAGDGALKRSITGDNAIPTFTDGECAFLVSGPWAVNDVQDAGIAYDISPVPPFKGGDTAQPFVGAQTFFVAPTTPATTGAAAGARRAPWPGLRSGRGPCHGDSRRREGYE